MCLRSFSSRAGVSRMCAAEMSSFNVATAATAASTCGPTAESTFFISHRHLHCWAGGWRTRRATTATTAVVGRMLSSGSAPSPPSPRFPPSASSSSTPQATGGPADRTAQSPTGMDMPAPPRPGAYVPPAERDPTDPSLSFLRKDDPLQRRHAAAVAEQHERAARSAAPLGAGQALAPQAQTRVKTPRVFADADAARVHSSSVHAGKPLLRTRGEAVVGSGYYEDRGASRGGDGVATPLSRLHVLKESAKVAAGDGRGGEDAGREMLSTGETAGAGGHQPRDTMFGAKYEFSQLEDVVGDDGGLPRAPPSMFGNNRPGSSSPDTLDDAAATAASSSSAAGKEGAAKAPLAKQIERDIKKLEYYHGSPQYPELLRQFREKYGKEQGQGGKDEKGGEKEEQQKYSAGEVSRGLESQPIDFHRTSSKLQAQLSSGPYGYSPVTIMQQHGVMRFQGYAFPPTTELGKLKGVEDLQALQDAHREKGVVATVKRTFNVLVGRRDPKEDYLATEDKVREDTHVLYRTLKLDAVQRRQMRFMLTDFDYKDRNTAFHVMMSYPYTDWIHVFLMVLVGWALYQLQVRFGAYEFYDEYLGLDLRQVPSVRKPFLACITVFVMLFFLFQPLLVASIATNRAYRIAMRRPIGPP